jgi:hypothetical protein
MGEADSKASNNMGTDRNPKIDFEVFKKTIAGEIESADSLDEIKARLKSQQAVESVELADYLLKSNPPQRDFIVEFKTDNGIKATRIVNVYDLGNQKFKLNQLRNE